MANEAKIRITTDNKTNKGFNDVERRLGKMSASARNIGGVFKKAFIGLGAAIGSVVGVGAIMINAMTKQEDAEMNLAAAIKNNGGAVDSVLPKWKEYAASLQKITVYGDEEILNEMAFARNLGITEAQMEKTTKAAIGLAAKYRKDLPTAMRLMGLASKGETGQLKEMGIVINQNMSKQKKFEALQKIGISGFKDAEMQAKTFSGSLKQLRNMWGDLLEVGGAAILQNFDIAGSIEKLKIAIETIASSPEFKQFIGELIENAKILAGTIANMAKSIATIAKYGKIAANFANPVNSLAGKGLSKLIGSSTSEQLSGPNAAQTLLAKINANIEKGTKATEEISAR